MSARCLLEDALLSHLWDCGMGLLFLDDGEVADLICDELERAASAASVTKEIGDACAV